MIIRRIDSVTPKACVFCGNPPENKNKEHIIPQWLIELTGKPTREAYFGWSVDPKTKKITERKFAFNQFVFPACTQCNHEFGSLEDQAKQILLKLMASEPILAEEVSLLLDWFDKVRVGLWLAMSMHHTNPVAPSPNFHITQRIGQTDRLLIIEKINSNQRGISFSGINSYAFHFMPSAFGIRINDFVFTNVATFNLLARRLGFPFSHKSYLLPDSDFGEHEMKKGLQRVMTPLFRKIIREKGLLIAQPMINDGLALNKKSTLGDDQYVNSHSLSNGVGNIWVENEYGLKEYGKGQPIYLKPKVIDTPNYWFNETARNIINWQLWLLENHIPSIEKLRPDQKQFVKDKLKYIKGLTKLLLKLIRYQE